MLTMPKNLPEPKLSQNAEVVLANRYRRWDADGKHQESTREMFWRVASAIAEEEAKYEKSPYKPDELAVKFYELMTSRRFLPNSPTLMNAGTDIGQLAACFVLPVDDSIEGIFDAVKYAAMIHKSGGGTGFAFSRLRPRNSRVGSTGGVASGPVSFMRIFNTATEQIKQGGKRRGANMGILRVDHPDILDFINAKQVEGEFTNFNLSVGLTEKFMEAVEKREDYDLVDPHNGEVVGHLNAGEVFDLLVKDAWKSGDPGIVFLDRINEDNPTPLQGQIESTNPCGEQPLLPYEACNLGSINLSLFVIGDALRWGDLKETVQLAVRFLDNVIDASKYPLPQIGETVRRNRKIGLGVMGFADMLYQLGIPYDSEEGIAMAEKVMKFIDDVGHEVSQQLAEERGSFKDFAYSSFPPLGVKARRNATVTTVAPTGTISIIGGCSSGIEPLFALSFTRNVMDGQKLTEVNPYFEAALRRQGVYSQAIVDEVAEKGSIQNIDLPEELKKVFVTAMDIAPLWHVRMQAAFQKHTDNAVSKTVNLPNSATEDDIREVYWLAYKEGCKGVTVYRDGCRSLQVLATGEGQKKLDGVQPAQESPKKKERPEIMNGFTQKVPTGLGTMYLTVNELDGKPFEVFATIGKSGHSTTAKAEAIGRLVSLALRSGIDVADIVEQLRGIGGEHPVFRRKGMLLSIPDAIAWVLESHYMKDVHHGGETTDLGGSPRCPECGGELVLSEGCMHCPQCGYSKC